MMRHAIWLFQSHMIGMDLIYMYLHVHVVTDLTSLFSLVPVQEEASHYQHYKNPTDLSHNLFQLVGL